MFTDFCPKTKVGAFLLGMWEFRSDVTWSDPYSFTSYSNLDRAYDRGREFAHLITFRRFDW